MRMRGRNTVAVTAVALAGCAELKVGEQPSAADAAPTAGRRRQPHGVVGEFPPSTAAAPRSRSAPRVTTRSATVPEAFGWDRCCCPPLLFAEVTIPATATSGTST
jgi:hypothetical protein